MKKRMVRNGKRINKATPIADEYQRRVFEAARRLEEGSSLFDEQKRLSLDSVQCMACRAMTTAAKDSHQAIAMASHLSKFEQKCYELAFVEAYGRLPD